MMNSDNATDATISNKRAKTDPNVAPTSNNPLASKTPKSVAQDYITAHVESLHFNIATILKKTGFDHINLVHKLQNKIRQHAKMELDPSLFPRSARIDFSLQASKKVEELQDYIQLKEDTNIYILSVKENLKARILATTALEISTLRKEILEHFVKGLYLVSKTIKTGEGEPDADIHRIVSTLIAAHHETLLVYFNTNLATFKETYKELLNVTTFPAAETTAITAIVQAPTASQYFMTPTNRPQLQPAPPTLNPEIGKIYRDIECLFLTSVIRYEEQVKRNDININLKKLDINHLTETATAEAEMEVGNEPTVSPENLKQLIAKETKAATSDLLKEIKKLQQQVINFKSPKGNGARTTPRGASTKKSQKKTKTKKVTFAASAQKADDADDATTKKKGRRQSKPSKKKTSKNSTSSETGRRK